MYAQRICKGVPPMAMAHKCQNEDCIICKMHIFICGAHSTGKTTIVNQLAERLCDAKVVSEVARDVIRQSAIKRDDFCPPHLHAQVFEKLQSDILRVQHDRIVKNLGHLTLYDRGLDPLMYAEYYLGQECSERLLAIPEVQLDIEHYRSSLVFVIHPQKECIREDGFRMISSMEEARLLTATLIEILGRLQVPFVEITELDMNVRIETILKEFERVKP